MAGKSTRLGFLFTRAAAVVRSLLGSPKFWAWALIWLLTRVFILSHVGYWNDTSPVNFEDVHTFEVWSEYMVTHHAIPIEETWTYPPGAALLMLIPRLGSSYGDSFVVLMLLFDLAGLLLIGAFSRREGKDVGVWLWLLGMPVLAQLPVLRFDLAPTVFAMAALFVVQRRPAWFGAFVGFGAALKIWPVVALFGEWDRRRLISALAAVLAAVAVVFAISAAFFDNLFDFLSAQDSRGLQIEAVATVPWHLRQIITGQAPHTVLRYGAWEIATPTADFIGSLLKWVSVAALAAAAWWWLAREREIRRGRDELRDPGLSRDFVFTVLLLMVVTSRVLSPQYMIWLLGLGALVLTQRASHIARPAWIVIGTLVLTTSTYGSAENAFVRNFALLVAAADASIALFALLRRSPDGEAALSP